ncbi:MAG: valine--tRNA ligase [bacterium]|nr:MAG: valine--tRNA ligase [bacterium]
MSKEMPKHFDPKGSEERWYSFWMEHDYFHADEHSRRLPYSIVIPPPNVTGSLHMGHALNNTLQDVLIRYMRMTGRETLWMPGTDHAGIATQNVVEKELASGGMDRHALGREKFIEKVWEWKEKYGGLILQQLQRLGSSCDWERERFTMDEGLSRAVREVFVRLYREGLIYQGDYIINWCPRCHTALSDLEVEHHDHKGHLYHIRYPAVDGSGEVVVATTRPETMLGDTAVAVNPADERYRDLMGKSFHLPMTRRDIPLIADDYSDMEFGTGAVKVTPAHDPNDFDIGDRHDLPKVVVIALDGTMTHEAGERYEGMDRYECRRRLVDDLRDGGYLVKVEDYDHAVGQCYRCQTVIEPILSRQWFVRMKELAQPAIEAVKDGRIRIVPGNWEKTYFEWMNNIRDWCISRQIWWGHRIPVWNCGDCGDVIVQVDEPGKCPGCAGPDLKQEEDVLDTWFSSALWPFSTMGWPDETDTLKKFYPTSCLVTGFDILFFWVARMIMMGMKFMGDVPFREVYIHALVRDSEGQKMSKSRGNVIDPLVVIDQYGADAFRFTLTAFAAMGRDIKLSEDRIEGYRNFINKIWNASKLVLSYLDGVTDEDLSTLPHAGEIHNRWIRSRLSAVIRQVRESIEGYRFNDTAHLLYQFFWHEYCDWYLELAKPSLYGDRGEEARRETALTAGSVLDSFLRLLHPVMPFVTEEIWQRMPSDGPSIMAASYPEDKPKDEDTKSEEIMGVVMDFITTIRNLRTELGIPPSARVRATFVCPDKEVASMLERSLTDIIRLARLSEIHFEESRGEHAGLSAAVVRGQEVLISTAEDLDLSAETERLSREMEKVQAELTRVEKKLANEQFLEKAPPEVVQKNRDLMEELTAQKGKLLENLERLNGR